MVLRKRLVPKQVQVPPPRLPHAAHATGHPMPASRLPDALWGRAAGCRHAQGWRGEEGVTFLQDPQ